MWYLLLEFFSIDLICVKEMQVNDCNLLLFITVSYPSGGKGTLSV